MASLIGWVYENIGELIKYLLIELTVAMALMHELSYLSLWKKRSKHYDDFLFLFYFQKATIENGSSMGSIFTAGLKPAIEGSASGEAGPERF